MADPAAPESSPPVDEHPVDTHPVWVVVVPEAQALDVTGPHEVFDAANRSADGLGVPGRRYQLRLVGADAGTLTSESGLRFVVDALPRPGDVDGTVLIPGGNGARHHSPASDAVVSWLAAVRPDRVATVCTGAFLAGRAGLLDGRRVATHWARAALLAEHVPRADVDAEAIWLRDGPVWSSAGVTAGIDLALAMVEADLGTEVAQTVARWLVVFLRRPGGQSQFSAPAWTSLATDGPIRRAQERIQHDPGADHRIPLLAAEVGVSPRHLTRLFRDEVGMTPARYVEQIRVEAARHHLESSATGLETIARICGFGTAETLRRSFHRRVGVSPNDYRHRFHHGDDRTLVAPAAATNDRKH